MILFMIQGIVIQILYLGLIYTVYHRIRGCHVTYFGSEDIIADTSDYLVHQLVKSTDNGNMRGPVFAIMCSLKPNIDCLA